MHSANFSFRGVGFGEGGLNLLFCWIFTFDLTDFRVLGNLIFYRPIVGFAEGRGSVVFCFDQLHFIWPPEFDLTNPT